MGTGNRELVFFPVRKYVTDVSKLLIKNKQQVPIPFSLYWGFDYCRVLSISSACKYAIMQKS